MRSCTGRVAHTQFLSTPSARRATDAGPNALLNLREFLSTPSARRATNLHGFIADFCVISIHALREEGDSQICSARIMMFYFYPRPPRGGRLYDFCRDSHVIQFLSTPSARRATVCKSGRASHTQISIHALREEGDAAAARATARPANFYPRPPRGGRRSQVCRHSHCIKFLSTPSARRATFLAWFLRLAARISIHALREEGDVQYSGTHRPSLRFLSTPSARRATNSQTHDKAVFGISIHALREEGDKDN